MPTLLFYTIKRKSPKEKGKVRLTGNNRLQPCAVKTITMYNTDLEMVLYNERLPRLQDFILPLQSCKSLLACTSLKPSNVQSKRYVLTKTGLSVFFFAGRCPKEFCFKKHGILIGWFHFVNGYFSQNAFCIPESFPYSPSQPAVFGKKLDPHISQ